MRKLVYALVGTALSLVLVLGAMVSLASASSLNPVHFFTGSYTECNGSGCATYNTTPTSARVVRADFQTLYAVVGTNSYAGALVYKSTDNGATWTSPGYFVNNYSQSTIRSLAYKNGVLTAVVSVASSGSGKTSVWTSSDGGVTWTEGQIFPTSSFSIGAASSSRIVGFFQTASGCCTWYLQSVISDDGGNTWKQVQVGQADANVMNSISNPVTINGSTYLLFSGPTSGSRIWYYGRYNGTSWTTGPANNCVCFPYNGGTDYINLPFAFNYKGTFAYLNSVATNFTNNTITYTPDFVNWYTATIQNWAGQTGAIAVPDGYTIGPDTAGTVYTASFYNGASWSIDPSTGYFNFALGIPHDGYTGNLFAWQARPYLDQVGWSNSPSGGDYVSYSRMDNDNAPSPPTNLAPTGWTNQTPTLSWTFVDPDAGDTPGGYQVQILGGAGGVVWDSGLVNSTATSVTVPGGILQNNQTYTWQVRTADQWGLWGAYSSPASIQVDTTLPTISSLTTNPATYTNQTSITVQIVANDSQSGLGSLRYSVDGGTTWGIWIAYTPSFPVTLAGPDGAKTIVVQVRDNVGNVAQANTSILLDTMPPTVSIGLPSTVTNQRSVTASVSISDAGSGPNQMRYQVDGGSWSAWTSPQSSLSFSISGDGAHGLNMQATDRAGNMSTASASLLLDTTPPTASFTVGSGWVNTRTPTMTIQAGDTTSGVAQYRISYDGGNTYGAWSAFTPQPTLSFSADGAYSIVLQVADAAGNVATAPVQTVHVDTSAPQLTLNINAGRSTTTSPAVTVGLQVSDADGAPYSVRLASDSSQIPSAPWQALTPSLPWTLLNPGNDQVCGQAQDAAGNLSSVVCATITLISDTTPPTVSVLLAGGSSTTTSHTIPVHVAAVDDTTPTTGLSYRLCNAGGSACGSWQSGPDWSAWDLYYPAATGSPGQCVVVAQVMDAAGNIGTASGSITLTATGGGGGSTTDAVQTITSGAAQVTLPTGTATAVPTPKITLAFTSSTATAVGVAMGGVGALTDWAPVAQQLHLNLGVQQGLASVQVFFRDMSGNVTSQQWIDYLVLTQGPTLSSMQWDAGATATTTGSALLHAQAVELYLPASLMTYAYKVDGGTWVPVTNGDFSVSPLAKGYHTTAVRVQDPVGNSVTSSIGIWSL